MIIRLLLRENKTNRKDRNIDNFTAEAQRTQRKTKNNYHRYLI